MPFARSYAIPRDRLAAPGFKRPHAASQAYTPNGAICAAYNWPTGIAVTPLTIVIGELGGKFYPGDVAAWAAKAGLPVPKVTTHLLPGADDSAGDADGEIALDWQLAAQAWSYMTGTQANILMVYGPNSGQAFADVMNYARGLPNIGAGSWSWGAAESGWSAQERAAFDAACQSSPIPWCSASGDNGSNDGTRSPVVDFPSASPWNIGCGGTSRVPSGGSETVWNNGNGEGTGGGFSKVYARPSWQPANSQGTGRMVPDWAAVADPNTGYDVLIDGQWQVIGGTSAVAPLMAGFLAVVNGARKSNGLPLLTQVNPLIWAMASSFFDVASGNNGSYNAANGPDPCSGLGRALPALFAALVGTGQVPTPTPTPTPTPVPVPVPVPVPTPVPTPPTVTITLNSNVQAGQWVRFASAKPKGVYRLQRTTNESVIEAE